MDDLRRFGFLRCAAVSPPVKLAEPEANANITIDWARRTAEQEVSLALFPELGITGFTCEDLFFADAVIHGTRDALARVAKETAGLPMTLVVGAPWQLDDGRLFNTAFVITGGEVVGAVPKIHLPNYGEFYGMRWFTSGLEVETEIDDPVLGRFPFGVRQLFRTAGVNWALEICEDLWGPEPPGNRHAVAGALLTLNPSASNELVAKAEYRRELVRMASAQRIGGYLYCSAGPLESTKDVVFGGHTLAAENGSVLGEGPRFRFEGSELVVDFDVDRLMHDRRQHTTFRTAPRPAPYPRRSAGEGAAISELRRSFPAHPFVPGDVDEFDARASEILTIQATALARRVHHVGSQTLVIGLSGGLDSTLAFLVCLDALEKLELPADRIHAVTMPGPGTGERTLKAARQLAEATGVDLLEVPIHAAVEQHLKDLGHDPEEHSVTYENAQARERTQLLFNFANKFRGLVVGTGDLSELALGWCTYNGDHMASYSVNTSVPKTMIKYLVRWYANHRASEALRDVLAEVLDIPISPELVPGEAEEGVAQHTEEVIGPYELHDFFLYHYVRGGATPAKIRYLAEQTFVGRYEPETIGQWLDVFLRRFHTHQFKRTTLPAGPKVGTITLSPRGDWRMPDETDPPR